MIDDLIEFARAEGLADDPQTRQLLAEAFVLQTVQAQTVERIVEGIATKALPATAGSLRLGSGMNSVRRTDIAFQIGGADGAGLVARGRLELPTSGL